MNNLDEAVYLEGAICWYKGDLWNSQLSQMINSME